MLLSPSYVVHSTWSGVCHVTRVALTTSLSFSSSLLPEEESLEPLESSESDPELLLEDGEFARWG